MTLYNAIVFLNTIRLVFMTLVVTVWHVLFIFIRSKNSLTKIEVHMVDFLEKIMPRRRKRN